MICQKEKDVVSLNGGQKRQTMEGSQILAKMALRAHHYKDIARYFIFFLTLALLLSGCELIGGAHRKEAKEELEIFGFVEGYNSKIKEAQNCLRKAEFNPGQVDGRIGWQTREAIKDFQRANQLKVTGYIDSKTWTKLSNYQQVNKGVPVASKDKIQLNSPGWTKKVQQALANAGFNPGPIDGKIGPKTKKAIVDFQKSKGLTADGTIDPKTWEKLSTYFPKD